MKLTNRQAELINALLGVKVTHSKNGHSQIHPRKLAGVAGRLGLKLEKASMVRSSTGGVIVNFRIGEDLGLSVEIASDQHVRLFLGSLVLLLSAGPDSENLKSISNQYYEVIDGKIIHSRKRESAAHGALGWGGPEEVPSD